MPSRRSAALLAGLALVAYLWRTGPPVWPYLAAMPGDFGYTFNAGAALVRGESPFQHDFDYPPLVPLLYAPLAPLGLGAARIAWYVLCQLCLLGSALLLWRPAGGDAAALIALALAWGLGGTLAENLALGQINPPLLLLTVLALHQAAARPVRASVAIAAAAAVKIWPGLLLLPWLRRGRRRGLALALALLVLSVLVPWLVYRARVPPPRLPAGTDYWMGTPALLSFSLPAAALRTTYRWDGEGPVPADWERGTHPSTLRLAPWRRRLSAAVSLATLTLGLAVLGLRLSWAAARGTENGSVHAATGSAAGAHTKEQAAAAPSHLAGIHGSTDEAAVLAFLTGLCIVAAPVSWYHYQLFLLPAGVLAAAACLRRRAWARLAAVLLALLAAGWANRGTGAALALGIKVPRYLYAAGLAVPLLDAVVLALLLAEIGRASATEVAATPGQTRRAPVDTAPVSGLPAEPAPDAMPPAGSASAALVLACPTPT